jgi:hypothetical protein
MTRKFFKTFLHFPLPPFADDKFHLQNYPPQLIADQSGHLQQQHGHHYPQYKSPIDPHNHHHHHHTSSSGSKNDEPNNNSSSKNNSSASSYEDTVDYDDSIQNQNHDVKETPMLKQAKSATTSEGDSMKYKCNDYIKSFANRTPYDEHHQAAYNGSHASNNVNDDYRLTSIDERKMQHEDGNSNDMRMNYASSDDMNQNAASSDHGEKLNSGSEDEGEMNG